MHTPSLFPSFLVFLAFSFSRTPLDIDRMNTDKETTFLFRLLYVMLSVPACAQVAHRDC